MPRAIWTGSIAFGLVNVPVRMYSAVEDHSLHFNYVHEPDGSRIGYEKVCKEERKPVPDSEIVKAFEYEKGGKPTGFDIDLVREVAKDLDADLDVIDVSFDDITSGNSLNNDVCDLAISAMTITGERARVLDFSSPYFDAKQALITPRGSGLDQLTELAGKRVGVQKETTGETYLSDFAPETTQVIAYDDAAGLQDALAAGQLDAAMLDNTVSGQFVSDNPKLKLAREFDTGEQYGMAVKKDGNIALLRVINRTVVELREDGTYDELYAKYLG